MAEIPPLWLRLLSCRPVLCLVALALVPAAIVWWSLCLVLGALSGMLHGVRLAGRAVGVKVPNPLAGAVAALSKGLADALGGWWEEVQRRYGDGT